MKEILTEVQSGVRKIKLNRVNKKNAITREMYIELANILNKDAENDKVTVTIITGTGDYFCSGTDFFSQIVEGEDRLFAFTVFMKALINYPKLLIAVVNGPAIGVGVTFLALCDIVYATDDATFQIPFIGLGLCTEACSSYTFPSIFGKSKTSELLYLGKKLTAEDACRLGFVSEVVKQRALPIFLEKLYKYGKLSPKSIEMNKRLMTHDIKNKLLVTLERECKQLSECFESEEFHTAITRFMLRKSKL